MSLGAVRVLLALMLTLLGGLTQAQPSAAPPSAAAPERLRVVMLQSMPPLVFHDAAGEVRGARPDAWALWSRTTGIPVEVESLPWAEAMARFERGDADVIDTITTTPARERVFVFSEPFIRLDVVLFYDRTLTGITDAESARGLSVGLVEADACGSHLSERGVSGLVPYPTIDDVIAAASAGDVLVFCMHERVGAYLLHRAGVAERFLRTDRKSVV